MTENELAELIADHPRLFHMAEDGSWQSIRRHGLLSTSALLDLYGISGEERASIESQRRPDLVEIFSSVLGSAVIRDQKPLSDKRLAGALRDNLSPTDWYRILNGRTFFWLTERRLNTLLCAGSYANTWHDVLVVESKGLIERHRNRITLAPMNTGNTRPIAHTRGLDTFRSIPDYPYEDRKRRNLERVVELVVEYSVPDIEEFVLRVDKMKCKEVRETVWRRGDP